MRVSLPGTARSPSALIRLTRLWRGVHGRGVNARHAHDADEVLEAHPHPGAGRHARGLVAPEQAPLAARDQEEQHVVRERGERAEPVHEPASDLVAADLADEFEYPDDAVKWRAVAATILDNGKVFLTQDQVFRKGYLLQDDGSLQFDDTLDVSSMYGVMMFSVHEMGVEYLQKTVKAIEDELLDKSPSGGTARWFPGWAAGDQPG